MTENPRIAIAVVGVSAILPDAPNANAFWDNLTRGRYSISDVDPARWDPAVYYDPDPAAPGKTYTKLGAWVREWDWNPAAWHLPVPPLVAESMDEVQKWALSGAHAVLTDYGWPARRLDLAQTGVILGNALAGERHYLTDQWIAYPEYMHDLVGAASYRELPAATRAAIALETETAAAARFPHITEDSMPGELANVIAGRIANLFDMHGPNYVTDAACASALAAMNAAVGELIEGRCSSVITGGIDRTMNPAVYVKFCKIGALSATGTRPYADGADGFVMGEGGAFFLLKRLADAERDGDRIYAVIRGLGGSSDGRGKGITAPNPIGQRLAVERAWATAGLSPATAGLIEGHGTSTRVGDVVEVESMSEVLIAAGAKPGTIALGSVKSNIGHLKAAAGAAGLLKTILALHHKVIPPSLHFDRPNPSIDFERSPLRVTTVLHDWDEPAGGIRRAGVSAFGFGGTNFHAVLDEYVPGRLSGTHTFALGAAAADSRATKSPLRGAAVIGAPTAEELATRLDALVRHARAGEAPAPQAPAAIDLAAAERIAIDFGGAGELLEKAELARKALAAERTPAGAAMWKALRPRGVFRGRGPRPKVAFLYTGQGSQYVNMLAGLRRTEPVVRAVFDEADAVMKPLLGRALSDILFVDPSDQARVAQAEAALRETEVTQPAVMVVDLALTRLLDAYGIRPDMTMGHSLGEYGALMAAGSMTFEHTLEAVSSRGREMSQLTVEDRGVMAAVMAPLAEIEKAVASAGPGVVVANVNSTSQGVIGGPTAAVRRVMEALAAAGHQVVELPVSHAFHTSIVAPVSEPLKSSLVRLDLRPPRLPVVSNVTGRFYPSGEDALAEILELLGRQVAEPVQFVTGLRTLYDAGARVFVEVGPKRALHGFAEDVLGAHDDVLVLFTNHPKTGELESFNQALCGLYASGFGTGVEAVPAPAPAVTATPLVDRQEPVVITGAALGLPGTEHVFDDANIGRILAGEELIDVVPTRFRKAMLAKHITRLVKREGGDPTFEVIDDPDAVIRLAGRAGILDLASEFGVAPELVAALDRTSQLALGAGIDALRDAGIPLVRRYRTTTIGTQLPEQWALPDAMQDDTGVIFASAMPGLDSLATAITQYDEDRARREQLATLEDVRSRFAGDDGPGLRDLDRRIATLRAKIDRDPYVFDRRFLFRVLSMGHSQFAQYIGARGPNTQVNSACSSTTVALGIAQDWIRAGRCRRVVVVAGDEASSDGLLEWVGAGFLASGAAATDDVVENAALPFDRRRHGMIMGMGAAALVVESAEAARERGLQPICEVVATVVANSAFHGTRLDVHHITQVMEQLVVEAEQGQGIRRSDIAGETLFVSHETYTPARGGSAAAEVDALRAVFGEDAGRVVIANTKGFTGHPMGVGVEDVVAVKALETGIVPPVPNFKEEDPELGALNLSRGGLYSPRYALRLAAGFGSQISMALLRWLPPPDRGRRTPDDFGYRHRIADRTRWTGWLTRMAGRPDPELEVVQRTLRIREPAPAGRPARPAQEPAPAVAVVAAPAKAVEAAPAPPTTSNVAAPNRAGDPVADRVLAMVAEKTGYPSEMLGLDLDLEADLGIDTVKQAELFAMLREEYSIQRDDKVRLRDYPTLNHVIRFIHERSATKGASPAAVDISVAGVFPRRVPIAALRPPLDLFAATGVTLEKGARVVVMGGEGPAGRALAVQLEARGVEVLLVDDFPGEAELGARLSDWGSRGKVSGLYWLPALDVEAPIGELDLAAWREGLRRRVKLLHAGARALGEPFGAAGTFLIAATALGGRHGYGVQPATAPMGGAVTGFVKAFRRERPDALAKAVDFEPAADPEAVAALLIAETLRDPAVVEVGCAGGLRWSIVLEERPASGSGISIGHDTVFLVTGAAGGIVSAIVADLAAASGGTLHLLDLAPEPDPADPDLARFVSDREGLKASIATRLRDAGERPTPALVEKRLAAVERASAALAAITAVKAAGGTGFYHQVDMTAPADVQRAMADVQARHGRIDVLIHAAGIEISHALPDKDPAEFARVLDVKSDGWFNMLRSAGDMPVGVLVAFSSVAARFGNAGQTDYSAANDLLCKSVSSLRAVRPETRAIAIDWTAWSGIGMATRGSIPRLMELAGVEMLPPDCGIATIRRELTANSTAGELVVAGRLGALMGAAGGTEGVDRDARAGGLIGPLAAIGADGCIEVEAVMDPTRQPFLDHHRIDGVPVLPGVMGIESMCELALVPLPGYEVKAVEDVEFAAPFKFYRDEPRTLTIEARFSEAGEEFVAACRLLGSRALQGLPEPQVTTHFSARVRLGRRRDAAPQARLVPEPPAETAAIPAADLYRVYFHGPAFQVLEKAWSDGGAVCGLMAAGLPELQSPAGVSLVTDPRVTELCFQTAGAWELGTSGRLALPSRVGEIVFYDVPPAHDGARLVAVVTPLPGGGFEADAMDSEGQMHARLRAYTTIALPAPIDGALLAPFGAALGTPR